MFGEWKFSRDFSTRVEEKGQEISFVRTFIIPRLKNRAKLNFFWYVSYAEENKSGLPSSKHNQRKKELPRGEFSVPRALLSNVYLRETWNVSIYPVVFLPFNSRRLSFSRDGKLKLEYCSSILTWNSNISQVFHQTSCTRLFSQSLWAFLRA